MIVSCHSDCSPDLSCAALPFGIPELSYEQWAILAEIITVTRKENRE